jgi:beta-lactamase regulating signal transducer with metallopeptidase domain
MGALVEIGLWNAAASAALALAAAAVSRLGRRPALAHTLWLLVLLKLVTPPLVPFSLPWPGGAASPPAEEVRPAGAEGPAAPPPDWDFAPTEVANDGPDGGASLPDPDPLPAAAPPLPWPWWAGLTWLAGSLLWAGWVVRHVVRFRRVLRRARLAPGPLQEEAEGLARRLGLWRCPDVWLVPGAVSPMVWALGRRPCLLFPAGLLERLDGAGRAALLAHELGHVRRRDHWVRLLELAATGLYWWHPVLWWARRELHEAEEQCCDAWAVWALGGDGRPYALALLQAVMFVSQARVPLPAGASGSVGQVSHLKRRLAMVMRGNTSRSLSWAGLGVVSGLGLLLLPLFPALGQDRPALAPLPAQARPADPAAESPKDTRDQEIEALKKRLKELEESKVREKAAKALSRVASDLDAETQHLQLKQLEITIAAKRKELQDLEAKAALLRAQMKGMAPLNIYRKKDAPAPPPKTPEGRVQDLEQKLDRIQKELDELRRELRPKTEAPRTLDLPQRRPRGSDEKQPLPLDAPLVPLTKPAGHAPDVVPVPRDPRDPAVKPPPDAVPRS